jgi:hypothetical protein
MSTTCSDRSNEARLRMATGRFRVSRFGFGDNFSSMVLRFGALKLIWFGFRFGFPPVDNKSFEIKTHMFIILLIITYLVRLLNLF